MSKAIAQRIQENYTSDAMIDRVQQALVRAGFCTDPLQWSDLVPFDQFHVRGLEATKELAKDLALQEGQHVLDVGSGLGGPARYLAALHGVHVTGIDLTPDFIDTAEYLSRRAGLGDKITFRQGDATELPFPDETFDIAWTQHVAMNIQDKAKLYKGIHRVLKVNGRLALYDPIQGNGEPVVYPTPWAREEAFSFVSTEADIAEALADAGFKKLFISDKTDRAEQWFRELGRQREQQQQSQKPPNPLSPLFILGPYMGPAIANFAQNVLSGRLRVVQIIAHKA